MIFFLLACAQSVAPPLAPGAAEAATPAKQNSGDEPNGGASGRGAAGTAGAAVAGSKARTVGDLGDHAFLLPIDAPRTVALVRGGVVPTTAAACGTCHKDHYTEWRASTHASAVQDLQLVAELAKPDQPRWLCLNCHAPTAPQRPERITRDTPLVNGIQSLAATANPEFDATLTGDGVGCATCHVRRDADGLGVVVGPRGSGRAPHRVRADAAALTDVCVRCHSPGPAQLSPTFTCWFTSAEEVAFGPSAGSTCTGCHMPETERSAAMGAPAVKLRRHLWAGGGVPKTYAGYDTLLARDWRSGLDVKVQAEPVQISLTNARAGHSLPTADPERHLRVEARYEARDGAILGKDVLRIGQIWDWGDARIGRPAKRLADDRLRPGETRGWSPMLTNGAKGAARLVVEVAHVRVTPENALGMASATLDSELSTLWPAAPALLPTFDRNYPLATVIYRETIPLDGSARLVATPDQLLAYSKSFAELPLEEKRRRLGIP